MQFRLTLVSSNLLSRKFRLERAHFLLEIFRESTTNLLRESTHESNAKSFEIIGRGGDALCRAVTPIGMHRGGSGSNKFRRGRNLAAWRRSVAGDVLRFGQGDLFQRSKGTFGWQSRARFRTAQGLLAQLDNGERDMGGANKRGRRIPVDIWLRGMGLQDVYHWRFSIDTTNRVVIRR
jgi:hypothetical protein